MTTTTATPPIQPIATKIVLLRFPEALALFALGLGIIADLLFYQRLPGISFPLFVALCLAALAVLARIEHRPATRSNRWLGVAALFFAALTAIRVEPTILVLNSLTALGLLLLQVGLFRGRNIAHIAAGSYLLKLCSTLLELAFRPFGPLIGVLQRLLTRSDRWRSLIPIARGVALAFPIVGFLAVLLMMADSVFADVVLKIITLSLPFSIDWILGHLIVTAIVGWGCAGALLVALRTEPQPTDAPLGYPPPWGLGFVEGLTVLIAVDLLFGSFMLIQAAYLFGGLDTLAQTQMTYAEYARRGFFELVLVAVVTFGLIWLFVRATRRDAEWQTLAFNIVASVLVILTIGLLSSAFQRMWLYEQAYGFTHLRLYTHTFMLWLVLALLLCLAALIADRPRWLSFGGLLSALAILATLTLANPEAIIVQANIARYQATGELELVGAQPEPFEDSDGTYRSSRSLDANYLARLSEDATPMLIRVLPLLPVAEQDTIRAKLIDQRAWLEEVQREDGWPAWHWARAEALRGLGALDTSK